MLLHDSPKKKVSFADDFGGNLVTIHCITEISEHLLEKSLLITYDPFPTKWLIKQASKGKQKTPFKNISRPNIPPRQIGFQQPSSDYLRFQKNLEKKNVALENVVLKSNPDRIFGTIKVKNLAYEKSVFVRVSFDKWQSNSDIQAVYKYSNSAMFDTFEFEFEIPPFRPNESHIEFAVCYECCNVEHWDSNNGNNYVIL
uniref:CBM21 domain-containing protein n=1 Tax=Acrobeloides nanus TaxID=290746 RepID=A0A914DNI7_9BILA